MSGNPPGSDLCGEAATAQMATACLMVLPAVMVERITETSVVLFHPPARARLQLTRPVYELFRNFYRPTLVEDVLPPEGTRRERALACLVQLQQKGFLVPPSVGIQPLVAAESHAGLPGGDEL